MDFVQMMIGGVVIPMWASRRKVFAHGYETSEVQIVYDDGKYTCMLMYPQTGQRVKLCECNTLEEAKMKAFA